MSDPIQAPSLPGTKRKQAAALAFNVRWMAETFGAERIGFLTLTCGDSTPEGFKKISERREASRRFNSLLTHVIRERYQCGVIVTERHRDGGIHFHLVCVVGGDIRGGIDFEKCFPSRTQARVDECDFFDGQKRIDTHAGISTRRAGAPDYSTAPARLRLEWKFWRERAAKYGFGRCQLQPMKKTGEALGFYIAKYISKGFTHRHEDDRGGRCVRYFGAWSKDGAKMGPPMSARHGSLTAKARAWRKGVGWLAAHWRESYAARVGYVAMDERNAKEHLGPSWAFTLTQWMRRSVWPEVGCEDEQAEWRTHNEEVRASYPNAVGIETYSPANLCPTPKADREVTRAQWEARTWSASARWRQLDETVIDSAREWAERMAI